MNYDDKIYVKEPVRVVIVDPYKHPSRGDSPEGNFILKLDTIIFWLIALILLMTKIGIIA